MIDYALPCALSRRRCGLVQATENWNGAIGVALDSYVIIRYGL